MSANGLLTPAELAPIYGPDLRTVIGHLRKDAAAAFNSMQAESVRRFHRGIGVKDSYRPLGHPGDRARGVWSQWAAWEEHQAGGALAAKPGTSAHGLGLAIDVTPDGRTIIDAIGEKYGWAKKWSDAQSERWHIRWRTGIWKQVVYAFLPLHTGLKGIRRASSSPQVYGLTKRLQTCGYLLHRTSKYTVEVERGVKHFQQRHHLTVDGVVGPFTWEAVKAAAAECARTHRPEV